MQITFSIDGKTTKKKVGEESTVRDIVKNAGLNEETGLLKLNGQIAHPLTKLKEGDEVNFVNIIYGG